MSRKTWLKIYTLKTKQANVNDTPKFTHLLPLRTGCSDLGPAACHLSVPCTQVAAPASPLEAPHPLHHPNRMEATGQVRQPGKCHLGPRDPKMTLLGCPQEGCRPVCIPESRVPGSRVPGSWAASAFIAPSASPSLLPGASFAKSTGASWLTDRVVCVLTTRMPRPTQSTTWTRQRPQELKGSCSPYAPALLGGWGTAHRGPNHTDH